MLRVGGRAHVCRAVWCRLKTRLRVHRRVNDLDVRVQVGVKAGEGGYTPHRGAEVAAMQPLTCTRMTPECSHMAVTTRSMVPPVCGRVGEACERMCTCSWADVGMWRAGLLWDVAIGTGAGCHAAPAGGSPHA